MVGYDTTSASLTNSNIIFAGAASGFITRCLCQPFDVLKIRFQLQVEPISESSVSKYRSLFQAVTLIYHEEGVKAFWKGHVPAQLLSVVYGASQFWCFEILTKKAKLNKVDKHYNTVNFMCGAVAGGMATLLSFPFDVVRTRLIAQSDHLKVYSGVLNALRKICENEGCLVLYRGLAPTIIQVAPHAGVQFMSYKLFQNVYKYVMHMEESQYTFYGNIVSGSLAGLCAKTAIYPLDLTRKRMQIQGFQKNRMGFGKDFVCKGMLDCLYKIYISEGFVGLFKGLSPSLIKAVVTTALHFSTYELICEGLGCKR